MVVKSRKPKTLKFKTREEWLAGRNGGIGGSDAAAAIGASKWLDPTTLWMEKLGLIEPQAESEAMYWGHVHEPSIGARYAEISGRAVVHNEDQWRYVIHQHPQHDFLLATLDFEQVDRSKGPGVLECKATGSIQADPEEYACDPPIEWQIQVQHQLMVTGMQWGTIACLIRGNTLVTCDIERNEDFIEIMQQKETEFWTMVLDRQQPAFDGSPSSVEALLRIYPKEKQGKIIALSDDALGWDERLSEIKEEVKRLKAEEEELKARIKAELGDAETGVLPGKRGVYRFKTVSRNGYTVQPTEFRQLTRGAK